MLRAPARCGHSTLVLTLHARGCAHDTWSARVLCQRESLIITMGHRTAACSHVTTPTTDRPPRLACRCAVKSSRTARGWVLLINVKGVAFTDVYIRVPVYYESVFAA